MTKAEYRAHQRRLKGFDKPEKAAPAWPHKGHSEYGRTLARQIERTGLPVPIIEYSFDAQLEGGGRGWRFDLCWPDLRVAVEVDGGAHGIKRQLESDIEKYQVAFDLGYRVLRVSVEQVKNGEALSLVRNVFSR